MRIFKSARLRRIVTQKKTQIYGGDMKYLFNDCDSDRIYVRIKKKLVMNMMGNVDDVSQKVMKECYPRKKNG